MDSALAAILEGFLQVIRLIKVNKNKMRVEGLSQRMIYLIILDQFSILVIPMMSLENSLNFEASSPSLSFR